jgi:hypothetical protein
VQAVGGGLAAARYALFSSSRATLAIAT